MSVDQADVIDYISTDRTTGSVLLTVSDHLAWEDVAAHLAVLQRKLERYVDFVRSGQLAEQRPDSVKRTIVIDVILKHPPNEEALSFFRSARDQLKEFGIQLAHRQLPSEG
jgi:lactam utilization protein B